MVRCGSRKRRDDCNAGSSGDKQEIVYDADGLVTEIQTYDSSNTLTAKQPFAYFDSRKLAKIINPVDTAKWTGMSYDARGFLSQIDAAGSLGKTVFERNTDTADGKEGRVTTVKRYNDASVFDSWNVQYSWLGQQTVVDEVQTGTDKSTLTERDDLGRTVKLTSPDMTRPILFIYDDAGRLSTKIEDVGDPILQKVHSFTYDLMNRPLTADYAGACPTGTPHAEIQQVYDALPSGVSCPVTGGCMRLGGRLAYVKTTLLCSSAYSATDGSWDQETFYSYDDAGRMIREDIKYDGEYTAPGTGTLCYTANAWSKLSRLTSFSPCSASNFAMGAS
jgi:hypothetical protein